MRPDRRLVLRLPGAGATPLGEPAEGRTVTVWCRHLRLAGAERETARDLLVGSSAVTLEARYRADLIGRAGLEGTLDGRPVSVDGIEEDVAPGRARRRWMRLTGTLTG